MKRNPWAAPITILLFSILFVPLVIYLSDHILGYAFLTFLPDLNDEANLATGIIKLIEYPMLILFILAIANIATMICTILMCARQTQILNSNTLTPEEEQDDESRLLEGYRLLNEEEQRKVRKVVNKMVKG